MTLSWHNVSSVEPPQIDSSLAWSNQNHPLLIFAHQWNESSYHENPPTITVGGPAPFQALAVDSRSFDSKASTVSHPDQRSCWMLHQISICSKKWLLFSIRIMVGCHFSSEPHFVHCSNESKFWKSCITFTRTYDTLAVLLKKSTFMDSRYRSECTRRCRSLYRWPGQNPRLKPEPYHPCLINVSWTTNNINNGNFSENWINITRSSCLM